MPFIQPLTVKAAKAILKERHVTMEQFRRIGRLDLSPCVRMTIVRCRTIQLIDESSKGGEGLAEFVSPAEQANLPACQPDAEGSYAERKELRIAALQKHHALQALLHG